MKSTIISLFFMCFFSHVAFSASLPEKIEILKEQVLIGDNALDLGYDIDNTPDPFVANKGFYGYSYYEMANNINRYYYAKAFLGNKSLTLGSVALTSGDISKIDASFPFGFSQPLAKSDLAENMILQSGYPSDKFVTHIDAEFSRLSDILSGVSSGLLAVIVGSINNGVPPFTQGATAVQLLNLAKAVVVGVDILAEHDVPIEKQSDFYKSNVVAIRNGTKIAKNLIEYDLGDSVGYDKNWQKNLAIHLATIKYGCEAVRVPSNEEASLCAASRYLYDVLAASELFKSSPVFKYNPNDYLARMLEAKLNDEVMRASVKFFVEVAEYDYLTKKEIILKQYPTKRTPTQQYEVQVKLGVMSGKLKSVYSFNNYYLGFRDIPSVLMRNDAGIAKVYYPDVLVSLGLMQESVSWMNTAYANALLYFEAHPKVKIGGYEYYTGRYDLTLFTEDLKSFLLFIQNKLIINLGVSNSKMIMSEIIAGSNDFIRVVKDLGSNERMVLFAYYFKNENLGSTWAVQNLIREIVSNCDKGACVPTNGVSPTTGKLNDTGIVTCVTSTGSHVSCSDSKALTPSRQDAMQ
ncbi:MAG: hypothetical protein KU29_13745 [Sulfurovum sp. FS06-10]|nr:MAG: hypothetical protein KU29_13745 [Sulfurovum sp. FS06-10]